MDFTKVTFETLPQAVSTLISKVDYLEQLFKAQAQLNTENTQWLSIDELCNYLPGKPAKATIYGKVHKREIPHKKIGKRLVFLKSDIDEWINSQGRKTITEIRLEATKSQTKKLKY